MLLLYTTNVLVCYIYIGPRYWEPELPIVIRRPRPSDRTAWLGLGGTVWNGLCVCRGFGSAGLWARPRSGRREASGWGARVPRPPARHWHVLERNMDKKVFWSLL